MNARLSIYQISAKRLQVLICVAIAVFLCATAVIMMLIIPSEIRKNGESRKILRALEVDVAHLADSSKSIKEPVFLKGFSGFDQCSALANNMETFAIKNGLLILGENYHLNANDQKSNLGQIQVDIRLKGYYGAIKNMLAELLASHPGLALDSIAFQRSHSFDSQLDANVHITFFYKKRI